MSIPKAERDPYTRVYHSIADDPRFEHVYDDDSALATWLRLLITAEAMFPTSVPVPRWVRPKALKTLIDAGLVDLLPRSRYRIHGLASEREKRSAQGIAGGKARAENAGRAGGRFTSALTSVPPAPDQRPPHQLHQPYENEERDENENENAHVAPVFDDDEAEHDALVWLAQHGCYVTPGNGYHRHLVTVVERQGIAAIIKGFETLSEAGVEDGDVKGFVFGVVDLLRKRPDLKGLADKEADEKFRRETERGQARWAQMVKDFPA